MENWFFFGDSLTEGVGSNRVSYVSELVKASRALEEKKPIGNRRAIHFLKMRSVDAVTFNPHIECNIAGNLSKDNSGADRALWIWNFACEGTTIKADQEWISWVENIKPEKIFVFRGSLESVIRPSGAVSGVWPWWVPKSWRGYASMDPRCYFSNTWWRKAKQVLVDSIKQKIRLYLLMTSEQASLLDLLSFEYELKSTISDFRKICENVYVLGMLPINGQTFPSSDRSFRDINICLSKISTCLNVNFLDWGIELNSRHDRFDLFYRDGFHPNKDGAKILADFLMRFLKMI